ncbi:cytochrome C and quinol oxidase polypeptide I [mine drainage metagenome]|uniref:Cytochrome C and quinol oxidase polypeptide I n=1 Tax=mine drainage metagenome TaxID=410659 RepID=A0A1J5QR65_9ZZZZ
MNISRSFMLVGVVFLVLGIPIGMYMGAVNNFALAPLHAHLNLLGFVLMTIFGILYRIVPAMADSGLAKVHFWLHTIGVSGVFVMLFLLLTGRITDAGMVPVAPASEGLVLLGILCYALNLLRNGR